MGSSGDDRKRRETLLLLLFLAGRWEIKVEL
jgi:hypothetical protein